MIERPTRRTLVQGLGAAFALPGTSRFAFSQYFDYAIDLTVDRQPLRFANGARYAVNRTLPSGAVRAPEWWPGLSAVRLSSGEIVVAIPPSPRAAYEQAMGLGARNSDGSYRADAYRTSGITAYPTGAIPIVHILNNGEEPTEIYSYAMRAAFEAPNTRVRVQSLSLAAAARDHREKLPQYARWLIPAEECAAIFERHGEGAGEDVYANVRRRWSAILDEHGPGVWSPKRKLTASVARFFPPAAGALDKTQGFETARRALTGFGSADVALTPTGDTVAQTRLVATTPASVLVYRMARFSATRAFAHAGAAVVVGDNEIHCAEDANTARHTLQVFDQAFLSPFTEDGGSLHDGDGRAYHTLLDRYRAGMPSG